MTDVRRHTRTTRTGRRVTVRRHQRDDGADSKISPQRSDREYPMPVSDEPEPDWDGHVDWGDSSPFGEQPDQLADLGAMMGWFTADTAALRARDAERPHAMCPSCGRALTGPARACQCDPTDENIAGWEQALSDAGY